MWGVNLSVNMTTLRNGAEYMLSAEKKRTAADLPRRLAMTNCNMPTAQMKQRYPTNVKLGDFDDVERAETQKSCTTYSAMIFLL
jgi:hypothetical protein